MMHSQKYHETSSNNPEVDIESLKGPTRHVASPPVALFPISTMKIIASLIAFSSTAAAFAPVQQKATSSTALSSWKDVGVTAPVGFFDPLGFSAGKTEEVMSYYREAELKHGRVAMAACLGWYLTAGGLHPAFNSSLSSDPLEAARQLPFAGWLQFILGCGAVEWLTEKMKDKSDYVPGDLLGTSYWLDNSDESWVSYQNKELNNGRLAMLAITGMYAQDAMFGNYGDMIFKH